MREVTSRLRSQLDFDADGNVDRDDVQLMTGVLSGLVRAASVSPNLSQRVYRWYSQTVHMPLTLLHNSSSPHAAAAVLGDLTAAKWKHAHRSAKHKASAHSAAAVDTVDASYKLTNHPLPPQPQLDLQVKLTLALFASIFLAIPLSYMPAAMATAVVTERVCRAKHVQLVSGTSVTLYWLSHFVADALVFGAAALATVALLASRGEASYVGTVEQAGATALLLLVFGASMVPIMHVLSSLFDSAASAQIGLIVYNLVVGFMLNLVHLVCQALESMAALDALLLPLYRLAPPFALAEGLQSLASNWIRCHGLGVLSSDDCASPLSWQVIGRTLVHMPIAAVLCAALLVLLDAPTLTRRLLRCLGGVGSAVLRIIDGDDRRAAPRLADDDALDADVLAEAERVASVGDGAELPLVIRGLRKTFPARGSSPSKLAIERLDLLVEHGECFGLLGVNGAGKTTTLSILTGAVLPSAGSAAVDGFDVVNEQQAVYQRLGYCPQSSPLLEQLTGRETLTFYAQLRGLEPAALPAHCEELLRQVGLLKEADRRCGTYSGGGQRKLSLAIALLGSPSLLLLDEPSCGLDPASRRQMWDVILEARPLRSIVLTSHSMEECEALCTRVGCMVRGRLRCLGGLQHLKSKFGSGYVLELTVPHRGPGGVASLVEAVRAIGGAFERVSLVEDNGCRVKLALATSAASEGEGAVLADCFEGLEAHARRLGIAEYAASQATLESVFLAIVRMTEQRTTDDEAEQLDGALPVRGADDGRLLAAFLRHAPAAKGQLETAPLARTSEYELL